MQPLHGARAAHHHLLARSAPARQHDPMLTLLSPFPLTPRYRGRVR